MSSPPQGLLSDDALARVPWARLPIPEPMSQPILPASPPIFTDEELLGSPTVLPVSVVVVQTPPRRVSSRRGPACPPLVRCTRMYPPPGMYAKRHLAKQASFYVKRGTREHPIDLDGQSCVDLTADSDPRLPPVEVVSVSATDGESSDQNDVNLTQQPRGYAPSLATTLRVRDSDDDEHVSDYEIDVL